MRWKAATSSSSPIARSGCLTSRHSATDGDRILRFFVNFNDHEERVWASKGTFEQILERIGHQAGLLDGRRRLTVRLTNYMKDDPTFKADQPTTILVRRRHM
jgi:hypothetical protein